MDPIVAGGVADLLARLPPHIDLMLHHQPHAIEQLAFGRAIEELSVIDAVTTFAPPRVWVDPQQLRDAIVTNSFWAARWTTPDVSGIMMRAAADPVVLLADLVSAR